MRSAGALGTAARRFWGRRGGIVGGYNRPGAPMSILLLSVSTLSSLALAGSKVDVCHKGKLLNVSSSAVSAHLGHGDSLPAIWFLDTDGDGYGDPLAGTSACSQPAGTVANDEDCDPDDALVNPGATEVCNGFDDDCDGSSDGPDALDAGTWYVDLDGDGFGDPGDSELACAQPAGTSADAGDCDDLDPAVNPAAPETCSPGDDDCDGLVDEGDAVDAGTWYADEDGDGYGDASSSVSACEAPAGHVPDDSDCDDLEAASFPGNPEVCDLVDNDCDLDVDEEAVDALAWYADDDGDGHGAASELVYECEQPVGYVADSQDCDDTDGSVSPAGAEVCDAVDNDCDAVVDEPDASDAPTWYADLDGDGYGDPSDAAQACEQPVDYVADDRDCDDGDAGTWPDAEEVCEDGIDQDCSGEDEACAVAEFCETIGCDGFADLVIGNISDGVTRAVDSAVFRYDGDFSQTYSLPTVGTQGTPEVADLDGDGYLDIVFANVGTSISSGQASFIYWGSASGYSAADRTSLATAAAVDVVALDANHDGWLDLAFAEYSAPGKIFYGSASGYSASNTQSLGYPITYGGYGSSYYAIQVEASDIDGDGILDVVLNGYHGVWTYPSGQGGNAKTALSVSASAAGWVALGDFDGDDRIDVAHGRFAASQVDVYLGDGAGGFGPSLFQSISTSAWSGAVSAGDFDGDGDLDLVTGSNGQGLVHYSTWDADAGEFTASTSFSIASEAAGASSVGDLDGDGYVDVALPLVDDGAIVYWGGPDGLGDAESTTVGGPNATYGTKIVTADTIVGQAEVELCVAGASQWVRGATAGSYLDAGAVWPETWYTDDDGDGYGDSGSRFTACDTPVDAVDVGGDCDDTDPDSSPDGLEVCGDGVDQDCSGEDEACAEVSCDLDPDAEIVDPDLVILGTNSDWSEVIATGDLDGDGHDDLLAQGPYTSASGVHAAMYGFFDPSATPTAGLGDAGIILDGTGNHHINRVQAGDVDLDGYDDLLLGAVRSGFGATASDSGKAYLLHGPFSGGYATAASAASATWTGVYTGGYWGSVFGVDVEVAGDHTGDGVNEWLVGDNRTYSLAGAVYLLNGAAVGSQSASAATATILGDRSQDRLGHAIGGADLNGDGFDDIAVGASDDNDDPSAHGGKVGIFYGPVAGTYRIANADVRLHGVAAYDYAGEGVLFSDDIDGDGLADVVFGARGHDGGASDGGAAYVITAMADGSHSLSSAYARVLGDGAGDSAGYTVAAPGDVDGDGLGDLLVGVPYADSCGADAGSVALVLAPVGTSAIADAARIWSGHEGTRMGVGLTVGDVNGDGEVDLMHGARGDGSGAGLGALSVTFGPLY
jgi:hypothetical protein